MPTRGCLAWVLVLVLFPVLGLDPRAVWAQGDGRSFPLQDLVGPYGRQGPDYPPAAGKELTGQVIDSVTGQPIVRALVESGDRSAMTDHDGRFLLEHASSATAHKPGYLETMTGTTGDDGSWILKLTPEAIVYGTVTDVNGQPVERLQVQLQKIEVRGGLSYWQQLNATTTNAEGEFRFAELPPGKYSLTTGFMVDGLADAASSLGFVPLLYPPPDSDSAPGSKWGEAAVTLHAGEHLVVNLTPQEEKLYSVRGVVRGPFELGVGFSARTQDNLPVDPAVRFFPDGRFRLRLPTGTFRLEARSMVNNQQFNGTREITVGPAGLEGVIIDLMALASFPVQLDYEASDSSQQASQFPFLNLSLSDTAADGSGVYSAQPQRNYTGMHVARADDPLVIPDVPPGHYQVQGEMAAPWYIASASCGNVDLMREQLVVGEGSGACVLRVELRDNSATIRFSIPNQSTTLQVAAFPLSNTIAPQGSAVEMSGSDTHVTGVISGLAPGRYLVIAAPHVLEVPYRDPGALEKYASWGKEVTLGAGETVEIELKPAPEA